jgi:hypothetical protein
MKLLAAWITMICLMAAQSPDSAASIPVDVRTSMQLRSGEYVLDVIVSYQGREPISVGKASLPWGDRDSMELLAVAIQDDAGVALARREHLVIRDLFDVYEVHVNERRSGLVWVSDQFPTLRRALEDHDVIVFWSYQLRIVTGHSDRFGGAFLIPRSGGERLLPARMLAGSPTGSERQPVAVVVQVQKDSSGSDRNDLGIMLENRGHVPITTKRSRLPWGEEGRLRFYAVDGGRVWPENVPDRKGTSAHRRDEEVTLRPGEKLSGTLSLSNGFRDVLARLRKVDVVLFWMFQLETTRKGTAETLGGWLVIPQFENKVQ